MLCTRWYFYGAISCRLTSRRAKNRKLVVDGKIVINFLHFAIACVATMQYSVERMRALSWPKDPRFFDCSYVGTSTSTSVKKEAKASLLPLLGVVAAAADADASAGSSALPVRGISPGSRCTKLIMPAWLLFVQGAPGTCSLCHGTS